MHLFNARSVAAKFLSIIILSAIVISVTPLPLIAQSISSEQDTAQDTSEDTAQDTTVETGDAESDVDAQNEINTNTTESQAEDETQEEVSMQEEAGNDSGTTTPDLLETENATSTEVSGESSETATTSPQIEPAETETDSATSTPEGIDATIENTNEANATTMATSTASTGDNTAEADAGNALVVTGDGTATANVVNVVNTNITDSYGFFVLMNILAQLSGNLDLRDVDFQPFLCEDCPPCDENCYTSGSLGVVNNNDANIYTGVNVTASTGGNTASSTDGSAQVITGDATAGANVVNIANTNITESNYLLVSINHFESWAGDLIFPSASFFKNLFQPLIVGPDFDVTNTNDATVENTVETTAETGANSSTGTESTVVTGDATSSSSVYNQVNTNLTGGSSIFVLIRVHGTWTGNVFSAPDNVTWEETGSGIQIQGLNLGTLADSSVGNTSVTNNNTAHVTNNVSVLALTGENNASSQGGSASVQTGNATAVANVINIVNTNVVGHNWLFAIINIFGDWNGNVAFGQPDLWVGPVFNGGDPVFRGEKTPYSITVRNNGDADATNVILKSSPSGPIDFSIDSQSPNFDNGQWSWSLGAIPAGSARTFALNGELGNVPSGNTVVLNTFEVTATEPDANSNDNSDSIAFNARHRGGSSNSVLSSASEADTGSPKLVLTKTSPSAQSVTAGDLVPFKLTIKNEGDASAHSVLVEDALTFNGDIVKEESWNLGEVFAGEEIVIAYDLQIDETAEPGDYVNNALVTGFTTGNHIVQSEVAKLPFTIRSRSLAETLIPLLQVPAVSAESPPEEVPATDNRRVEDTTLINTGAYVASAVGAPNAAHAAIVLVLAAILAIMYFLKRGFTS